MSKSRQIKDAVKKIVALASFDEKKKVSDAELQRRIQERAYELYVKRGCTCGNDTDDWYEAERQVKAEIKAGR